MRHISFALVLLFALAGTGSAQSVILGALEDVPGRTTTETNSFRIRILFQKVGTEWVAYPHHCENPECLKTISSKFPNEVRWTVAFDGRTLGTVLGRTSSEFHWYADIGLQDIGSKDAVPTIGKRSTVFGGFTGDAVYRPLVTISQPSFSDPDRWTSHTPTEQERAIQGAFRKHFGNLCKLKEDAALEPLNYKDSDIKVRKLYASKGGSAVARVHLENAIDCNDDEAGFGLDDSWFTITPGNVVSYLDSGIWLVDAGDYDNDGRSELLFAIDRYNEGGYELFYDGFRKHAVFSYSFH